MNGEDRPSLRPIEPPHGGGNSEIDARQYRQGYFNRISAMFSQARRDYARTKEAEKAAAGQTSEQEEKKPKAEHANQTSEQEEKKPPTEAAN